MPEYIEREAIEYPYLYMSMWGLNSSTCKVYNEGVKAVHDVISAIPAADVVSRAAFDQVMWERDVAMEQLKEHGIPFGGEADVVAVVRCKECKHFLETKGIDSGKPCGYGLCKLPTGIRGLVSADDFCSYGERRGDDATC